MWATISDHATWTAWHEDHDRHEALTDQRTGVGAQFATKEWLLRSESEIVRWEPGAVLGWTIRRATGLRWLLRSYYSELTVEPVGDDGSTCLVHYRVAFTGTWVFWALSAYTVGQTLGSVYLDARASLKKLDHHVRDRAADRR